MIPKYIALSLLCLSGPLAYASIAEDTGYDLLSSELGSDTPDGSSVAVSQVEAPNGSGNSNPNASDSELNSKAFLYVGSSAQSSGNSTHATTVAKNFFGESTSIAPGLTRINIFNANDWIYNSYLRAQFLSTITPLTDTYASTSENIRIVNNSWISFTEDPDADPDIDEDHDTDTLSENQEDTFTTRLIHRADLAAVRDSLLFVNGMNNDSKPAKAMAQMANGLSVGLTDGTHAEGLTSIGIVGRQKPDLVANPASSFTSYATPIVSSAAALLLDAANDLQNSANFTASEVSNVERPPTLRALLMAGAEKTENWSRVSESLPLDASYGAGQVNIYNSYHILAQGQQTANSNAPLLGWSHSSLSGLSSQYYDITIPSGSASTALSVLLAWNQQTTAIAGSFDFNASITDLQCQLYLLANGNITGDSLITSDSINNLEHLYLSTPLEAGDYRILISNKDGTSTDYSLAWHIQSTDSASSYKLWQAIYTPSSSGLNSDSSANGDGDNWTNLEEYAYQLDPSLIDGQNIIQSQSSQNELTIQFPLNPLATDLSYTVQVSSDLVQWDDGARYTPDGSGYQRSDGTDISTEFVSETTQGSAILIQEKAPIGSDPSRLFLRIQVELIPF